MMRVMAGYVSEGNGHNVHAIPSQLFVCMQIRHSSFNSFSPYLPIIAGIYISIRKKKEKKSMMVGKSNYEG